MLMLSMCFFCCVSDTSRWSKYRLFRCYTKCGMHFIFMRFALVFKLKRWGIECTSSQGVSKVTFFQAKRNHCPSSSSVLGVGSLYVASSTIIQMVSRGFTSHAFAGRSSFSIKLANPSDTMPACMKCALPFPLQGFPTFFGNLSPYRCARNFDR